MALLRNLLGVIGVLFIGLAFYSLFASLMEWSDGLAFSFHAIDTVYADVFGGLYIDNVGAGTRGVLTDLPAFFVLGIVGIILAWWGSRPRKPKPKFRKG